MADTKTLLDATLESYVNSQRQWISSESNLSETWVTIPLTIGETLSYIPPYDGWLMFDTLNNPSAGTIWVHGSLRAQATFPAGSRFCVVSPATKGKATQVASSGITKGTLIIVPVRGQI